MAQLATLQMNGYVNSVGGKYIFPKTTLQQLKALLGGNGQDPSI